MILAETDYQGFAAECDRVREEQMRRPIQDWLFRNERAFEIERVADIHISYARNGIAPVLLHKHRFNEPCDEGDYEQHRYFIEIPEIEHVQAIQ